MSADAHDRGRWPEEQEEAMSASTADRGGRAPLVITALAVAAIVVTLGAAGVRADVSASPTDRAPAAASLADIDEVEAAEAGDLTPDEQAAIEHERPAAGEQDAEPSADDVVPAEPGAPAPSIDDEDHEPGSLEVVEAMPLAVEDAEELDATAEAGSGLELRIVDLEPVDGEAMLPGEVGGPALRVVVEAANPTAEPISLAQVQVDLSHGDDEVPGMLLSGPDVVELPEELAPGERVSGAVVFRVPPEDRDRVRISVMQAVDVPVVVFEGAAG